MEEQGDLLPPETIEGKIYLIRGRKVMVDHELARLYGVATRSLTQAVKRNMRRFPADFMFQLTEKEVESLRFQFGTSKIGRGGRRYLPYAFTEQGVAMLSSVLNSERAIQVNIQIMRAFTKLRAMLASHEDLRKKVEEMEKKYDANFQVVFAVWSSAGRALDRTAPSGRDGEAIKKMLEPLPPELPKRRIGFHTKKRAEIASATL